MPTLQITPASFMQLDAIQARGGFDALPGGIAFRVAHVLDLVETRHRVSDMAGVLQGFLALRGEGELPRRQCVSLLRGQLGMSNSCR